jgi:hypothetical protein
VSFVGQVDYTGRGTRTTATRVEVDMDSVDQSPIGEIAIDFSMSMIKAVTGNIVGLIIAIFVNYLVLPMFGHHATLSDSIGIMLIFAVVSIVRGYVWRRLFASGWMDRAWERVVVPIADLRAWAARNGGYA